MTVSLSDQYEALVHNMDRKLDALQDDLDRRTFRGRVMDLAVSRFLAGFDQYGDAACHWTGERTEAESLEELADWLVYQSIGGMAR